MARYLFVGALLCVLASPATGRAQAGWFDLRVPGAVEGLLLAAGLDAEPVDGSRLTPHLLHRLQKAVAAAEPETLATVSDRDGGDAWSRPGSARLRTYLNAFRVLRARWRAVEQRAGEVSMNAAGERRSRGSLADLLEALGLGLARNRGGSEYRVLLADGGRRSPYEQWLDSILSDAGWSRESIQARLNRGETMPWDPEHFVFSLPVSPGLWRSLLDGSGDASDAGAVQLAPDAAAELLARVIADPVWRRLYGGLAGLDATVVEHLAEHSEVLRRPSAHLAAFLETLARLPRGHRLFVLGAWQDGPDRQSGVDALWRVLERMPGDPAERSRFLDPAAVLRAVMVENDGSPLGPASRDFWNVALRERTVGRRDLDALSSAWEDGPVIDAAFVLGAALGAPPNVGRNRLQALGFLQRVFHDAGPTDVPTTLAVARAFSRHSMLLLSLERMGIRDPEVYTSLLRTASQFSGTGDVPGWSDALLRFQGAVALVERARLARVLPVPAAGDVLVALAALPADRGVTDWLAEHLLPALDLAAQPDFATGAVDRVLLAVLAGVRPGADVSNESLTEWEGLEYRFDREAMQLERFERTRGELYGPSLDAALTVRMQRRRLAAENAAVDDIAAAAGILRAVAIGLETAGRADSGADVRAVTHARRLQTQAAALGEVAERGNRGRLGDIVATLHSISEALAADALRTLVYAVHLAPADGLVDGHLAARHDLGADPSEEAGLRRTPWTAPSGMATTRGWSVQGSLLSLDLALAHLYLPRVSRVLPSGGQRFIDFEDLTYLTQAVALFNPAAVDDAQVAAIADAIRRGRQRVRRLAQDASDIADIAREVGLDPPRYSELELAAVAGAEGLDRLLWRTELFWLGLEGEDWPGRANWGAPATGLDGCLCLRMPLPGDIGIQGTTARPLAFRFADLQLALVEEVDRLVLPASIVGDLLPMATRELLDGARVTHSGDIEALFEYVAELSSSRVEDYVASLVYSGPFYPPGSAANRSSER